jgi:hypothetical protein
MRHIKLPASTRLCILLGLQQVAALLGDTFVLCWLTDMAGESPGCRLRRLPLCLLKSVNFTFLFFPWQERQE